MPEGFLIYGATGFTGDLVARLAARRGMRPILAGRNPEKVEALASELGLEWRAFSLDDLAAVDRGLAGVQAVLHCAGPFVYTSAPIAEGCLQAGVHYLDISGEIPVYAALQSRDADAQQRGVMLLPGAGLDVVPSDCLAAHLKRRLPGATYLALALTNLGPAGFSRGTAKTSVEMLSRGGLVRRGGRLVTVPLGSKTRRVDFGRGPVEVIQAPWGDVFTAYYSTAIPNIEDYIRLSRPLRRMARLASPLRPLLGLGPVKGLLKAVVDAAPPGPTAEQRARSRTIVWGEVQDNQGGRACARISGPEGGYTWTPQTALAAVERVLAGDAPPGFQTPAKAYGPDFVLMEGVSREDLI